MATTWFTVDDKALRVALNKSLVGLQTDARAAMDAAGKIGVSSARRWIEKHGKVDTGNYRDSLFQSVTSRRGRLVLDVGPPERLDILGSTLEHGRRPGSRMPPPGVLLGWMARHGIPEEAEFPIRRKIARDGMNGQPFPHMAPAADDVSAELDKGFGVLLDRLEANFYG